MKTGRTFAAYRYFLIQSDQISLYDTVKEKRREAVESFFHRAMEKQKLSFDVDDRKQILAFERKVTNRALLFIFGSEKYETKYHESDTGIEGIVETNLPYVYLIFDIERQLLLLEMKTSVFKNISQAQKSFKNGLDKLSFNMDLKLSLRRF